MRMQRQTAHAGAQFLLGIVFVDAGLAIRKADLGDLQGAHATLVEASEDVHSLQRSEAAGSAVVVFADCLYRYGEAGVALLNGGAKAAQQLGSECLGHVAAIVPRGASEAFFRNANLFASGDQVGEAEYALGDYGAAERSLRQALTARTQWPLRSNRDRREQAGVSIYLAMAIARQGRFAEAQNVIAPVVAMHRELAAHNHDDAWQRVELAEALLATALADTSRRAQLLNEASALIARAPAEMAELHSVGIWRERIREAQRAGSVAAGEAASRDTG